MLNIKRRGFTLVELLIVIVVIGVLAAMMMLSSTEAVTTAKAAKIIADMSNMRKALLVWYTDNYERVVKQSNGEYKIYNLNKSNPQYLGDFLTRGGGKKEVTRYFDGASNINLHAHNDVKENADKGAYFLCSETVGEKVHQYDEKTGKYSTKNGGKALKGTSWFVGYHFGKNEKDIAQKVAARAASLGLVGGQKKVVSDTFNAKKGDWVYLQILSLE